MSVYVPRPRITPPLDEQFQPLVLANHSFLNAGRVSGKSVPLIIALERGDSHTSSYATEVFAPAAPEAKLNLPYVERLVKTLLWQRGGWRIVVGGPREIGEHIQAVYSPDGPRGFDAQFMSGVYERPFTVEMATADHMPPAQEKSVSLGRHLEGCRIGFDAGASDRKVAAVKDGEVVYSEEVVWNPRVQTDPEYHYREITAALKSAAAHLPRVDAIGVSAAGIYINNRVAVASLFRGVAPDLFKAKVRDLFLRIQREWGGIPLEVANDGEVTALAGAMALGDNAVLGIALGSSEAGGYVDTKGNLTTRLNELAFVPFDLNPEAPVDEWSGDRGVGAQYFSQTGVIRLAPRAGIQPQGQTPAEQLASVQKLLAQGDARARKIWETLGCELGYAIAHYADIYHFRHVLVLGRVTSGEGGPIMLERAQEVLQIEFPGLQGRAMLHLPDESNRRVGQAVAAASLPALKG